MCVNSPKAPPPPAKLPEAPVAPDVSGATRQNNRRRFSNTILTSGRGVTDNAPLQRKTLLGA